MSKLIKEMLDALNAVNQNKTQPFDRQGEVKRIEGKIAWVKLEGSDRETPIQMTIACDVGDTVQARIGGGSAWLTGNLTAPPTDDKKANEAISMVTTVVQEVQEQVEEALEDVATVDDVTMQYCLSDSSSTFTQYGEWSNTPPTYVSGKYYWTRSVLVDDDGNETYGEPRYSQDTQLSVETDVAFKSNNNHFWHDSSGAYVTTANKNYSSGYATRITSSGILQSYSGNLLSAWTGSGIGFYAGDGTTASNSTQLASFGSNVELGNKSGKYIRITNSRIAFIDGANSDTYIGGIDKGNGTHSIWIGSRVDDYNYVTIATEPDSGYFSVTAEKGSSYYSNDYSVMTMYYNVWSVALADYSNFYSSLQLERNRLILLGGGRYESNVVFKIDTTTGNAFFYNHLVPDGTDNNCGTGSSPWHNVYVNTYFASTTTPSSLSQDYAVAWHKTDNGNYVLCRPSSSRKWKKDIEPISDVIADPKKLYDVRVVQFRYKDKNADDPNNTKYNPTALDVGFIAEEVAEAYPLGAVINENGEPDDWNARRIIPPMLALIQEQNKRITALEERLS